MKEIINIDILSLGLFSCLLLIPLFIFRLIELKLSSRLFIAIFRMIIQLSFVGIYLEFIFKINSLFLNLVWILVMIMVANFSVLNQIKLDLKKNFLRILPAYIITIAVMSLFFLLIFDASRLFSARYLIPLVGMVLGNILRANVVAIERFYTEVKTNKELYYHRIACGASLKEATLPIIRTAYKAGVTPQMTSIANIGLVSLPGMMTGQLLGGSAPIIAIKYQIMIMEAIFLGVSISVILSLLLSVKNIVKENTF